MNRVSSALANTASSSSHLSMADSCTYRRTSEAAVALGTLLYLLIIYSVIITLCDEYLTSHALCIMVPLIAFKRRIVGLVSAFSTVGSLAEIRLHHMILHKLGSQWRHSKPPHDLGHARLSFQPILVNDVSRCWLHKADASQAFADEPAVVFCSCRGAAAAEVYCTTMRIQEYSLRRNHKGLFNSARAPASLLCVQCRDTVTLQIFGHAAV